MARAVREEQRQDRPAEYRGAEPEEQGVSEPGRAEQQARPDDGRPRSGAGAPLGWGTWFDGSRDTGEARDERGAEGERREVAGHEQREEARGEQRDQDEPGPVSPETDLDQGPRCQADGHREGGLEGGDDRTGSHVESSGERGEGPDRSRPRAGEGRPEPEDRRPPCPPEIDGRVGAEGDPEAPGRIDPDVEDQDEEGEEGRGAQRAARRGPPRARHADPRRQPRGGGG